MVNNKNILKKGNDFNYIIKLNTSINYLEILKYFLDENLFFELLLVKNILTKLFLNVFTFIFYGWYDGLIFIYEEIILNFIFLNEYFICPLTFIFS